MRRRTDGLLTLTQAAQLITEALTPSGLTRPITPTAVRRWSVNGFHGTRLRTILIGNRLWTRWEWISEFFKSYIRAHSDRDVDAEVKAYIESLRSAQPSESATCD